MIVLYQRQVPAAHPGEEKDNEELNFETQGLEGHERSRPHRVRLNGGLRGRGRRRNHAGCRNQHQHDLLEDLVGDEQRCHTG